MSSYPSISPRTLEILESRPREAANIPYLFRLVQCGRPLNSSSRHILGDVVKVTIGRGEYMIQRTASPSGPQLSLLVPDPFVSSSIHATLHRKDGRWVLVDEQSRNGTFVHGKKVSRHELRDGDIIELGSTFFLFRLLPRPSPDEPWDLDGTSLNGQIRGLATFSPRLAADFRRFSRIASSLVEVLILGESGTGKELIARALAELSQRHSPFIPVNCGALPSHMVESELFGYCRDGFTGLGLIRSADGGTLFLDEVGELPSNAQSALLRVLQERQVTPIGGMRPIGVNFRLCSASHRPLDELVAAGHFRGDLLARIWGFTLTLPPLRARQEDFGLLLSSILERVAGSQARTSFTNKAMRTLLHYDWPFNIRQLEKCMKVATILAEERPIDIEDLPMPLWNPTRSTPTGGHVLLSVEDGALKNVLVKTLTEERGNISAVARKLRKARVQIRRWLDRFGIDAKRFRRVSEEVAEPVGADCDNGGDRGDQEAGPQDRESLG